MKKIVFIIALLVTLPGFGQSDTIKTNNPPQPKVVAKSGVFEKLYGSAYGSGLLRDTLLLDSGLRLLFDDGTFLNRGIDTTDELATKDYVISEIDSAGLVELYLSDSLAHTKGWIFAPPDSFEYEFPFNILRNPYTGEYLIDPAFNLRTHAAIQGTGTTYYVDVENGNDAWPGTRADSAFKTLGVALVKTDVSTISLDNGYYYDRHSWRGLVPTRSIEIIGTGDSVILTNDFRDLLTFTAEGGLYKAFTDTIPANVWDRLRTDPFGDAKTLNLYASKAQVDTSTTGAYYYASDTLYIRLQDFRAPDSFVTVFTQGFNIRMRGEGLKYYFKNIHLYGGSLHATNLLGTGGGCRVYADSVTSRGGAAILDGVTEAFLFNSSFAKVKNQDLINYDPENGVIPRFVEYNVTAYNNIDLGYTPGGSDQASSAHNSCIGLRINSNYSYTNAQGVADVNGCQSWLINCSADSAITSGSENYFFGTGATFGRAWMQDCSSSNTPPSGDDLTVSSNQVVHINNFISDDYDFTVLGQLDSNYHYQLYAPVTQAMVLAMIESYLLNHTAAGTDGQTVRYVGKIPTANSFLTNTGLAIGVGTSTPGYDVEIFGGAGGGDATFGIKTPINGVATTITFEGIGADWTIGALNTLNSGALIFTTSSLGSSSADMVLATNGNLGLSTTDVSTDKLNVNGTVRIATTPILINTDSVTGFVGTSQRVGKIPRGVFMQNIDTATSGNITFVGYCTHYSATGTTATWTLPTVAAGDGHTYFIKNRGSGNLTINTAAAGNDIYDTSAVNTYVLGAGLSIMIHNDGTYYTIHD